MSERAATEGPATRASAELLIDRHRLSELLGREVRATRLRFKPGLSTSAVLMDAAGQEPPGWIQVSHPAHLDKLGNALELAGQRGQQVHLAKVDGLTIAHGTIDTDPRLQKGLDSLRPEHPSVTEAVSSGRLQVLRYNPQRRLVLRQDGPHQDGSPVDALVLRVTTGRQVGTHAALRVIAGAGVPVVEPLGKDAGPRGRRVSVWPWFGAGDLASLSAADAGATAAGTAATAAGAALARLHRIQQPTAPAHGEAARMSQPFRRVPDSAAALSALVDDLAVLDRAAAERMRGLVSRVIAGLNSRTWETGLIHGDFSADQVLVGRAGEDAVRLTDFDRAGLGPLVADHGSFVAAELLEAAVPDTTDPGGSASGLCTDPAALPLARALLSGYADADGTARQQDDPEALRPWTARALLGRVLEPFRAADPDWVAAINRRLDQVSEVAP